MAFTLKDIENQLKKRGEWVETVNPQNGQSEVEALTYDSREVKPGTLFFCKGKTFKEDYLHSAVHSGAVAYVSEQAYDVSIPGLIVKHIRSAMPIVADFFYQKPYQSFHLTGITGTKGKTTTTSYLCAILDNYEKVHGGPETAYISSSEVYDGTEREEATLTTPESLPLYQHFEHVKENKIPYLTMEVSSQALKYDRVKEVAFEVVAFLNISEDHISPTEHPTFEDYFSSKLKIFSQGRTAVINLDSDHIDRIMQTAKESPTVEKIITTSRTNPEADYYASDIQSKITGNQFIVHGEGKTAPIQMKMSGIFNVDNALVAIAIARYYGIPVKNIQDGLSSVKTKGRMEVYATDDHKIVAIVDFAHNKLSFEELFEAAEEMFPDRQIGIVFGAPGNKAVTRRKDLADVSSQHADFIVVTMDDPDYEQVADICQSIVSEIEENGRSATTILNRPEAIHYAFKQAEKSHQEVVLLIAGKGDEDTMIVNGQHESYPTDAYYVQQEIQSYNRQHQADTSSNRMGE